jgi:WD40 repeat protein
LNNQSYERPPILQFVLLFAAFVALLLIILSGRSEPLPIIRADNVREIEEIARFGHGQIFNAAWSPDGNIIALAGSVGIWLYDAHDLDAAPRLLEGHTQIVRDVAFHPDGRLLASAGNDSTIRLWDVSTGEEQHVLRGHQDVVLNVTFSPDGQLIASAGSDPSVRLWDVETGTERNILTTAGDIYSLSFNPSGTLLAALTDTDQVYVWDIASGKEQTILTYERIGNRHKLVFSSDGQYLVAGSHAWVNAVWSVDANFNISDDQSKDTSTLDPALIASLGFNPGSLASGWRLTIDPQTGIEWFALQNHGSAIDEDVAVSPDGRQIVTKFLDHWDIFDLASPPASRVLRTVTDPIDKVALSPDHAMALITTAYEGFAWRPFEGSTRSVSVGDTGRYIPDMLFIDARPVILSSYWEGGIELLDAETGKSFQGFEVFSGSLESWDFDVDKKRAVMSVRQGATYLFDFETGQEIAQIPLDDTGRRYRVATFSSDGMRVALAEYNPECDCNVSLLWDGSTTTALGPFPGTIYSFAFSPGDRLLAVGGTIPITDGFDGKVQIWDLQAHSEKGVFTGPPYMVDTLLFNSNSRYVAGSGFDGSIWLWDIDQPDNARLALKSDSDYRDYSGMAFSPDGRLFAVGTWQGEIILFNVATGSELTRLVGHKAGITDLVFSANGTLLLSGSHDGTARLWGINPPPLADVVQNADNSVEMPMATMTPSPTPTRGPTIVSVPPLISPTPTGVR